MLEQAGGFDAVEDDDDEGWASNVEWIGIGVGVGVDNWKGTMGMPMAPVTVNQLVVWGANPGGTLGTAQANPCCWLTPIGS